MKNVDRVTSIVFMLIGIVFYLETTKLPEGSKAYPRFMIGIMVFLTILLFIKSFISKDSMKSWSELFGNIQWKRFLFVFFISLIYVILINILGFFVTTFLYLVISMIVLKATRLTVFISVPSFLLILFLIFKTFLNVPLPTGIFI